MSVSVCVCSVLSVDVRCRHIGSAIMLLNYFWLRELYVKTFKTAWFREGLITRRS